MAFLEICGLIVIVIVITQVLVPLLFPNYFRLFWIFRKKEEKPAEEKIEGNKLEAMVKEAVVTHKKAAETIKKVQKKTKENLEHAKDLDNKLDDLK